jgi:DNA-binding transcriptional MerR regulator
MEIEKSNTMEFQTIRQVSVNNGISARMLRYYEQIGLLESNRIDDYSYRVYDEIAIKRLQQIILLRKLQIPIKQIKDILKNQDAVTVIEIFKQNIDEIDEQITALSAVKSILVRFVDELQEKADVYLKLDLLNDKTMLAIAGVLSFSNNKLKEKVSMEELNKADESIRKLTDKNVRIINIPSSDVASYRCEGMDPEAEANEIINNFIKESNLVIIKPDLRHFGFNAPNPKDEAGFHGYEMWVTIPDDFDVPTPLVKKHFDGGLYCAHMIPIGAFDEWRLLADWLNKDNDKYEFRGVGSPDNMFDSLEECLNYINHIDGNWDNVQLDLLIPIKKKG